jgi:hypothetical protein
MLAGFELPQTLSILDEWERMADGERAALAARLKRAVNVGQVGIDALSVNVAPFKGGGDPV